MKINAENIDYNAVRLVDNIIGEPLDYPEDSKEMLFAALGEVRGVMLMAEAMKEVLKQ